MRAPGRRETGTRTRTPSSQVPDIEPASSRRVPAGLGRIRAWRRETLGSLRRTVLREDRPIVSSSTSAILRRSGSTSSSESTARFDHARGGSPIANSDGASGRSEWLQTANRNDSPTAKTIGTTQVKSRSHISLWLTPRTRALLAVGLLALLSAIATIAARIYTDLLWFGEVGHPDVYWDTLRWK